jgi:hypothetical protein
MPASHSSVYEPSPAPLLLTISLHKFESCFIGGHNGSQDWDSQGCTDYRVKGSMAYMLNVVDVGGGQMLDGGRCEQREGMGRLEYQAMPFVRDVDHDGV